MHAAPLQENCSHRSVFLADALEGLTASPPSLPSKYFYDETGSRLFDQICDLDEYYLTRVETEIMERHAGDMAAHIGTGTRLIEYGSGSSVKTRVLLDHLSDPLAYVPVDISAEHLLQTADELSKEYPDLDVQPVVADFTQPFQIPATEPPSERRCIYFPGSTIGNFTPQAGRQLLAAMADCGGEEAGLLIGFDLQKDVDVLEAAYNDEAGVTAAFNKNLLHRINAELDGDIAVEQFEHSAFYNDRDGRIEMHLVSRSEQKVSINGHEIAFATGESIRTEYSHKYTLDGFAQTAEQVGWQCNHVWTDDSEYFAVMYLER